MAKTTAIIMTLNIMVSVLSNGPMCSKALFIYIFNYIYSLGGYQGDATSKNCLPGLLICLLMEQVKVICLLPPGRGSWISITLWVISKKMWVLEVTLEPKDSQQDSPLPKPDELLVSTGPVKAVV